MRPTPPSTSEQEFPFGWRYVKRPGSEELDQVALTLEDVLHPQEGDVIPGNTTHDADRTYLATVFRSRELVPPVALVTHDLLIDWGVEGIRNHSPDVAVFVGLRRDPRPTGLLDLGELDGRCELAIEVVSPSTRANDVVAKVDHYFRVGIPLYLIIDQPTDDGPRSLIAYRRSGMGYARIPLDEAGCVDVPVLGLKVGMRDDHVVCHDLRTGRELGDYTGIARRLEELELRGEQQEQVIEAQTQEIEEQVEARQEAERKSRIAERFAEQQRLEREEAERKVTEALEEREAAQRMADEALKEREAAQRRADEARRLADQQRQEADRLREEADRALREAEKRGLDLEKERRAREEVEKEKRLSQEQADQRIRDLEEMVRRLQSTGASG